MNEYPAGQLVDVTYTLTPSVDAVNVTVKWAVRNDTTGQIGPVTTLTLGSGVTHLATGVYQVSIDTTGLSGTVLHQIVTTGIAQGAQPGRFKVEALPL